MGYLRFASATVSVVDDASDPSSLEAADRNLLLRYYDRQYERFEQLENQRLTFTNIVVAASVIAYALLDELGNSRSDLLVLTLVLVALINIVAAGFVLRTNQFIKLHRRRAHEAMQVLSSEISTYHDSTSPPLRRWHNRDTYSVGLHGLIVIFSLIAYFL